MTNTTAPRITVTLSSDNGGIAPLYKVYPQQLRPQQAYLEFDPAADGLTLEADYSGEIGGSVPARVWNQKIIRLNVPARIRRDALEGLAGDEKLAGFLEQIKAGYESDYERGRLTDEAMAAVEAAEYHLSQLDEAEVWDAGDWVAEAVWIEAAAQHQTFDAYMKANNRFESDDPDARIIEGDIPKAVAEILAGHCQRRDDKPAQKVARMLKAFDADEYGYLVEDDEE